MTAPQTWKALALAGRWDDLAEATRSGDGETAPVATALWHARALRAQGKGHAADAALRAAATGPVRAAPDEAAALGEELLQCAWFTEVEAIATALSGAGLPVGDFLRAGLARETGRHADALTVLAALERRGAPWSRLAQLAVAWVRLKQGWLKEAEAMLAPHSADTTPATQKLFARFELACGRFAQAAARLEALATRQPVDWEWPILLAAARASGGGPLAECLALAERGLQRCPRHAEGWSLVAHFRLALGDETGGRKALAEALAVKPWLDNVLRPFVESAVAARRFDDAQTLLQRATQLAPTPQRAAMALDLMRLKGAKVIEVVREAERLASRHGDDPEVLRACAAAFIACRRHDPAALMLERVLDLNPYDRAARNNLAALYRSRGDMDDAMSQWRDLMAAGDRTALVNLAQVLTERGDLAEADAHWRTIEALGQGNAALVHRGMADLLARRGEMRQALDLADKACAQEPSNSQNWLLKARILNLLEGARSAGDLLRQAESRVDAPLQIHRGLFGLLQTLLKPDALVAQARQWREAAPEEAEYRLFEASALRRAHDWPGAEAALREAARLDDGHGPVELTRFYLSRARYGAARRTAEQWVRADPTDIRRWAQLAEVCFLENKPDAALEAVGEGLKREPTRLALVRQKVGLLQSLERHEEAVDAARTLWQARGELEALSLWVGTLDRALRRDEAVTVLRQALAARPKERALRLRLARQLQRAQRDEEALAVLFDAHQDEPGSDIVAQALIRALMQARRSDEARDVMHRFVATQPDRFDLQVVIADIALEQGLVEEARRLAQLICVRAPDMLDGWLLAARIERRAEADADEVAAWQAIAERFPPQRWARRAVRHWMRLDMDEALGVILNRWRDQEPDSPAPWWVGFEAAKIAKRHDAALALLDGVERRQGRTAETLMARATIADELGRMTEAITLSSEATVLEPANPRYLERLVNLKIKAGDWDDFDNDFSRLEYLYGDQKTVMYGRMFFNLNCHPAWEPGTLYEFYRRWFDHNVRPSIPLPLPFANSPDPERRLRIGYVSPDFRQHAVAKFSEPMLMAHDREAFDIYGYAHLERGAADPFTERFKAHVHHWREIRNLSPDEFDRMIREDQIDILVDLAGHTSNNGLGIFSRRPAPILASHIIGAGQTTGMPAIDYLIADPIVWPDSMDAHAAERIERLDTMGMVYRPPDDLAPAAPLPCLERGHFTFGVFARPIRVNRRFIRTCSLILKRTPESRLRFEHGPYLEPDIQDRYRKLFAEYDIPETRLEFAHTRPYWNAFHAVDLQLDPFPAGSVTTATEGLLMERLVVTLQSRPAMGRLPDTQLAALGLRELCSAQTEAEYVEKAVRLAENIEHCAEVSRGLRDRFMSSSIMDYDSYARKLESAYRSWWRRWCQQHSATKQMSREHV